MRAQSEVQAAEKGTMATAHWFDGDLFPGSLQAARTAPVASVPLLAGFNRDEIRIFEIIRGPKILPMTRSANEALVRQQLQASPADRLMSAYADTKDDNRALATHLTFGMPTLHFGERHAARNRTWFYRVNDALRTSLHGRARLRLPPLTVVCVRPRAQIRG